MLKRLLSFGLALAMLICLLPVSALAVKKPESFIAVINRWEKLPDGYTGIYDEADLLTINDNLSGKYILMDDIKLSPDWEGLGNFRAFKGVLDGNGYTISGLNKYINAEDGDQVYAGLFHRIENAVVKNLRVQGQLTVYVEPESHKNKYGTVYMGGIAAYAQDSTISNCVSEVKMEDNQNVVSDIGRFFAYGGIVGYSDGSRVEYCRNRGDLDTYEATGGIMGTASYSSQIYACLNEAKIHGWISVGGIVGQLLDESFVSSCANEGQILCTDTGAGIAGDCEKGTLVIDCLNTGYVSTDGSDGGFTFTGGMVFGNADIERCVHVGKNRFGAIRSTSVDKNARTEDCYYMDESAMGQIFASGGDSDEEFTGMLSAEEMKDQESFNNFDFTKIWTLDEDMDYPYPTALLDLSMENLYKIAYVNELLREIEEDEDYLWVFGGSGAGSLAAVLSETYEDAGLHIVNKGWTGINSINDCLSFDFDVENDFDVLLADLLIAYSGMESFEELAGTEIFGEFSDMITHLCNSVEGLSTLEDVQNGLTEAGTMGGGFTDKAQELMDGINKALGDKISMGDVNKAFTLLGCVVETVGEGVNSVQELIDFFTLTNAYAGAGDNFTSMLRDIAYASNYVESNTGKDMFLRLAVNNFVSDMESTVAGDPLAFYTKMGEEIVDLGQTGANCIVNVCSGFSDIMPVAAGIRMGFGMGCFFGDQVTNMDAVSYYGTMMDMAGYFAECCFEVVMDYREDFMADTSYENALRLNSITDLYLRIQSLSCQYAFEYSMALAEKSVFKEDEHLDAAVMVSEYQMKIDTLLYDGNVVTIDPDGGISGFIASCPVTVVVEDEEGNEIARLESGKETRAEGCADYYFVFGENMDSKAGLYGAGQNIRILGEGEGSMDLLLFDSKDGEISSQRAYMDVPVEAGDEFIPEGLMLVANGEESIAPECGANHSWDEGKITKEPSTEEEGERLYTCVLCGETKTEPIEKIEIVIEPFKDVAEDAYYYESVQWAVRRGITTGVGGGLFGPSQGCTRAQVVTFLWRAAGEPKPESGENPFMDVKSSDFYYDAVLWAVEQGITSGMSRTSFAPSATCTRGQIVTFLYRAAGEPEIESGKNPFRDISTADYYYDAVLWAVEREITTGVSARKFAPLDTCTRGQIVTFLYRNYNG